MRVRKEYYDSSVLSVKKSYFRSLPEKQRRHYIASEYLQLGVGSQRYLAAAFGCSRQVIVNGVKELQSSGFKPDYSRQRRQGGGRKKKNLL